MGDLYRCLPLSLSIQLTALAVLSASVPVIAKEPAVSVHARAAMEVCASVGTAASATRAAVQRDPLFSQTTCSYTQLQYRNFYSRCM